jgi:hypothetical protein
MPDPPIDDNFLQPFSTRNLSMFLQGIKSNGIDSTLSHPVKPSTVRDVRFSRQDGNDLSS